MGFQLTIAQGKEAGREFLFEQSSVVIGRTSECDVILYDPGVSRRHARIFEENDAFFIEDLASANGTKVNGERVKKVALSDGDRVELGPVTFEFAAVHSAEADIEEEPAVSDQSTRIVSFADVKRQRNKGSALAPQNAGSTTLETLKRSPTRAMSAVQPRLPAGVRSAESAGPAPLAEVDEEDTGVGPMNFDQDPDDETTRAEEGFEETAIALSRDGGLQAPIHTPPARPQRMTAAERARLRRESQGISGKANVLWTEASQKTRKGLVATLIVGALALVGGAYYAVLMPQVDEKAAKKAAEPTELSRNVVAQSFGVGPDVEFERVDFKSFGFEFTSPTKVVALLRYQARDISQGEVALTVNGHNLEPVPPDLELMGDRSYETVIPWDVLKKNERNELIFDNVKNPPERDAWRIWNLTLEIRPLPELPAPELVRNALSAYERGKQRFDRRMIGARNLYEAWRDFRDAWLYLEAHADPKPSLYAQVKQQMNETQRELDHTCTKLMLEVEQYYNQNNWDAARSVLEHVKDYFPNNDQACPAKAEQKRYQYGL